MISFDNINRKSFLYEFLYHYVKSCHNRLYYKTYDVVNADVIPHDSPVVAISNHQNGLSDALGILFAFDKDGRRPVFIARADIFKKDFVAKLLRFIRIMPAFRAMDVGMSGVEGNDEIFNKSAEILCDNGVVCLFPEAGHEDCHHLGTFKKGFARIAFRAAEMSGFQKKIMIQPMGNHYSHYIGMQSRLAITFGEPFDFTDLYDLYKENPHRAQKILTDRAREKVNSLMLDIKDKSLYEEYDTIRKIYDKEYLKQKGLKANYFPNQLKADQVIVKSLDELRVSDGERFDRLMKMSSQYTRMLEKLHLRDWIFRQKLTTYGFFLRLLLTILLTPLIVLGFICNFVPYNASTLITRRIKDQMLHASFHLGLGVLVSFPLWYTIIAIIVGVATGIWWIGLLTLLFLPFTLFIYFKGKVLWKKLYNRVRRFRFWFYANPNYLRAVELRKNLMTELNLIVK